MTSGNANDLAKKYTELKKRLPGATDAANQADAALSTGLPYVSAIRDRVFLKIQRGEPVEPMDAFIACYGEDILRQAASSSQQEWLNLSAEVARVASEIENSK